MKEVKGIYMRLPSERDKMSAGLGSDIHCTRVQLSDSGLVVPMNCWSLVQ